MSTDKGTQVSGFISGTTRELLEKFVRSTGVKKGHVIESALRHYLQALRELPADVVIHPRIVVTRRSGAMVLERIRSGKPTKALRDLMADDGD